MFTGLIEDIGKISQRQRTGNDVTFEFQTAIPTAELALGESIAVNGVCLTVTRIGDATFRADASVETMQRSALGQLAVGDDVHLERAMAVGDRLGGHIVQGHVDGVGRIASSRPDGRAFQIELELPAEIRDELVEKGSICVDGVSMTVNELTARGCRLTVVPFTELKTLLVKYSPGRELNIETDIIGKYVRRFLGLSGGPGEGVAELLEKYGYTGSGG